MNATRELLRNAVADFYEVPPAEIGPGFALSGRRGDGSIARAALDATIRKRVGKKSSVVHTAATFGQLEADLFPDGPAPEASTPAATAPAAPTLAVAATPAATALAGGIGCGVDIESVSALPEADDYWEHPFYQATFTPAEIAFCLTQPRPRPHLAARWCAKEALRKCDPAFLNVELNAIEVARSAAGAPTLRQLVGGTTRAIPHALSLSHTEEAAVAVVVSLAHAPAPMPVGLPTPAPAPAAPPEPSRSSAGWLQAIATVAALGVAGFALYRTYLHG